MGKIRVVHSGSEPEPFVFAYYYPPFQEVPVVPRAAPAMESGPNMGLEGCSSAQNAKPFRFRQRVCKLGKRTDS